MYDLFAMILEESDNEFGQNYTFFKFFVLMPVVIFYD